VRDLAGRWQSDVLNLKPDWVSIMIGIHDVWRQFDAPLQTEWHVSLDEYSSVLEQLVRTTRPQLKGLVLMTPYFIEPNRADPMRVMMDMYGRWFASWLGNAKPSLWILRRRSSVF
jgi:lysophospholipase L1-like esterase